MFARDHERIAAGKLVRIDVPTAGDAMDVMIVGMSRRGFGRGKRFTFALGQRLFSFHRSLQPERKRYGFEP